MLNGLRKIVSANITISNRHFDMIDKLLPQYTEGATFHLFHSIESIATAGIIARIKKRPENTHMHRIEEFHGAYNKLLKPEILNAFKLLIKTVELIIKSKSPSDRREPRLKILYYDNQRQTEPKDLLAISDVEEFKKRWDELRSSLSEQIIKLT